MVRHAFVDSVHLIIATSKRATAGIRPGSGVVHGARELLEAMRMLFLEEGAFSEERSEILAQWLVSTSNKLRLRIRRMFTFAEAILCFNLVSSVVTPICSATSSVTSSFQNKGNNFFSTYIRLKHFIQFRSFFRLRRINEVSGSLRRGELLRRDVWLPAVLQGSVGHGGLWN